MQPSMQYLALFQIWSWAPLVTSKPNANRHKRNFHTEKPRGSDREGSSLLTQKAVLVSRTRHLNSLRCYWRWLSSEFAHAAAHKDAQNVSHDIQVSTVLIIADEYQNLIFCRCCTRNMQGREYSHIQGRFYSDTVSNSWWDYWSWHNYIWARGTRPWPGNCGTCYRNWIEMEH